jgi:hypothetical protein
MPFKPFRLGLHFEIVTMAVSEDSSQSFLMTKQILKSSQNCVTCNNPMVFSPCTATKSSDLYIDEWTGKGLVSDIAELTEVWSSS